MNREIKFRAWDKEGETMLSWEWVRKCEFPFYSDADGTNLLDENTFALMQYTGSKDKNGKEIYEGDVVKVESDKPMVVEWSKRFASFVLNRDGWMYSHWFGESCEPEKCEVIGNIYETPELLNNVLNVQGSDTTDVK